MFTEKHHFFKMVKYKLTCDNLAPAVVTASVTQYIALIPFHFKSSQRDDVRYLAD